MKEKIKRFFVEKKELLIFVGILTLVFAAVITIANITLKSDDEPAVQVTDDPDTTDGDSPNVTTDPDVVTPEVSTFGKPVADSAITLRCYYNVDKDEASLETAVIINGNNFYESKGVTYANEDDSSISAYAIYDGVVLSVEKSDTYGNVVSIDHGNEIVSYYSSLASVSVAVGDNVQKGDLIGTGGTNAYDPEASNHLTLEVKVQGVYVDPEEVFTKEAAYVSALINEGK